MGTIWKFRMFEFEEDSRTVVPAIGKPFYLRPQFHALFTALIRQRSEVVSKEDLIQEIPWEKEDIATEHDVENVVHDLRGLPYFRELIVTVPRVGYRLGEKPERIGESLHILPGISTPAGALFVYSSVDYGTHDYVERFDRKIPWEARTRHMVRISEEIPDTISIPFRHTPATTPDDQAWWVVVLPTRVNAVTGEWTTVDLREYQQLVFEARFRPPADFGKERVSTVKVRLEDDSTDAAGGGGRQSTCWFPDALILHEGFARYTLSLDRFDWSQQGFFWNTRHVNRARVGQIVYGYDDSLPPASGTIEITHIAFSR